MLKINRITTEIFIQISLYRLWAMFRAKYTQSSSLINDHGLKADPKKLLNLSN
jgi:hypothetical protein